MGHHFDHREVHGEGPVTLSSPDVFRAGSGPSPSPRKYFVVAKPDTRGGGARYVEWRMRSQRPPDPAVERA